MSKWVYKRTHDVWMNDKRVQKKEWCDNTCHMMMLRERSSQSSRDDEILFLKIEFFCHFSGAFNILYNILHTLDAYTCLLLNLALEATHILAEKLLLFKCVFLEPRANCSGWHDVNDHFVCRCLLLLLLMRQTGEFTILFRLR